MKRNHSIILIMTIAIVVLFFMPLVLHGGKPVVEPTEIHSPVIIGYGNVSYTHPTYPWSWVSSIMNNHPQQIRPEDGSDRGHVHCCGNGGDLSHGGQPRYVLDVRVASDGSSCLIATAEGVYDDDNPTWWHVPAEDVVMDKELLHDTEYVVGGAKWSPDLFRVAFSGQEISTGDSGIFLADVGFDGTGHPDSLSNIFLAVPDVGGATWGSSTRFCYSQPHATGNIWYADLSQDPNNPTLIQIPITGDYPAMSPDGNRVSYVREDSSTSRRDIFYWDIALNQEVQVTNKSRFRDLADGIYNPSWSPDGQQLCFAVRDHIPGIFAFVYRIEVEGTSKAKKISFKSSLKGVPVGALGVGFWRD